MGASNSITIGQWSSLKAGATFSGTLGAAFSSFTGIKTDLKLVHCDFTIDKKEFVTAKMKAAAQETRLAAERIDVIANSAMFEAQRLKTVIDTVAIQGQSIQTANANITLVKCLTKSYRIF
ncbi:hypothetical protein [Shewanella surugensis]|uniref:Uncharacterized protein n=1 Tax=Shewanella surugensis TaxID=212020 RepID=A0ABT0LJY1_9GAMM|nr:hypothetical protein [Shewanella surugensis]MCL1128012.1 hypothetical protein [Shewanella surugensis]